MPSTTQPSPDASLGDRLANNPETRIREATAAIEPRLVEIRRDIHAHPELAFEETRTAGIVAAELARLGIPHRTGIGRTGVVGADRGRPARPDPRHPRRHGRAADP